MGENGLEVSTGACHHNEAVFAGMKAGGVKTCSVGTSMASFLVVGWFGGLLHMPRVIFIAYLLLFVTALSGPSRTTWSKV